MENSGLFEKWENFSGENNEFGHWHVKYLVSTEKHLFECSMEKKIIHLNVLKAVDLLCHKVFGTN